MNNLNDEQMDKIIKEKFKQDNIISDKANSIFLNFNPQAIPDDNKGDFEVDNVHYWTADIDNRYVYCMKGEFMQQDLYKVERSTGKETCIASGIGGMARNNADGRISFYVNEDNYTIYELDDNIVYRHRDESVINEITNTEKELEQNEEEVNLQDLSVTDSPILQTSYDENFDVLLKEDGSISILLHTGALKRLGVDLEKTTINENVSYNVYGSAYGIENEKTHMYYAGAKEFCFAPGGRTKRECLVYRTDKNNLVAIDILNAIECGSFTGAKTSTMYVEGEILSLYYGAYSDDVDENGEQIPTYNTILIKGKDKDGKEITYHMYMPCEDL